MNESAKKSDFSAYNYKLKGKKSAVFKRLLLYMMRYKFLALTAVLFSLCGNLLALAGPKLAGLAIDNIETGIGKVNFQKVFYYLSLMLIFYLINSVMQYVLQRIMIRLSQNVIYSLRKEAFSKMTRLPVSYFDTNLTGDIISRYSYDVETVGSSICNDFITLSTGVITTVGSLIMMCKISPELLLVFVVTIPLSILVTMMKGKKVRPLYRKRSVKLGELNGYMEEMVSGHKTIKVYNQEETIIGRFSLRNDDAVHAHYTADYYGMVVGPTVSLLNNISMALIGTFGSILYIMDRITIGNVSSFILYSRKFSGIINELGNIYSDFQSALSAAERIFTLIDEPEETLDVKDAKTMIDTKGNVEFNNVKFGYSENNEIIHNLSFKAPTGKLVAIVGHTGAGKTTLINLLMRFYDIWDGNITLDDNDIRNLTRKSLRLSYAMVLQDTWLFNGTVYDNIAYGKENATREEVVNAAKSVYMHSFIMSLPKGYDTIINDDGVNFSQGQKQLLTIARAMLVDANMLIFDEATSNVDTITEIKIQKAMTEIMQGKTCFIIAHRLSTIKNADTILVVDKGDIVEQGTHNELLQKNGAYAQLYYSQFNYNLTK